MKDARELLAKLRAAGVEPMPDYAIAKAARCAIDLLACGQAEPDQPTIRRLANLLEARATLAGASAKLAEVREWAEDAARGDVLGLESSEAAFAANERSTDEGRRVLEILDREPGP